MIKFTICCLLLSTILANSIVKLPADRDKYDMEMIEIDSNKFLLVYGKEIMNTDLKAIFIDANGQTIGNELTIETSNSILSTYHKVVKTSSNNIMFIWHELNFPITGTSNIYAKVYSLDMTTIIKDKFKVVTENDNQNHFPNIAVLPDNNILVVFKKKASAAQASDLNKISAQKISPDGALVGTPTDLITHGTAQSERQYYHPVDVKIYNNQIYISYAENYLTTGRKRARTYIFNLNLVQQAVQWISAEADDVDFVETSLLNNGNIAMFWSVFSGTTRVRMEHTIIDSSLAEVKAIFNPAESVTCDHSFLFSSTSLLKDGRYTFEFVCAKGSSPIQNSLYHIVFASNGEVQIMYDKLAETTVADKNIYLPLTFSLTNDKYVLIWSQEPSTTTFFEINLLYFPLSATIKDTPDCQNNKLTLQYKTDYTTLTDNIPITWSVQNPNEVPNTASALSSKNTRSISLEKAELHADYTYTFKAQTPQGGAATLSYTTKSADSLLERCSATLMSFTKVMALFVAVFLVFTQ